LAFFLPGVVVADRGLVDLHVAAGEQVGEHAFVERLDPVGQQAHPLHHALAGELGAPALRHLFGAGKRRTGKRYHGVVRRTKRSNLTTRMNVTNEQNRSTSKSAPQGIKSTETKPQRLKLGIDVHLSQYTVVAQFDGASPRPARR